MTDAMDANAELRSRLEPILEERYGIRAPMILGATVNRVKHAVDRPVEVEYVVRLESRRGAIRTPWPLLRASDVDPERAFAELVDGLPRTSIG
jgi:hypothetical protein